VDPEGQPIDRAELEAQPAPPTESETDPTRENEA
jgi:hypothetical protein